MAKYLVLSAVVVAIYGVVVMAKVFRFESHDAHTSVNCYDHVTSHGVAATKIACATICGRSALCRGFVYEPDTKNCNEIRVNNYPDRRCLGGSRKFYGKEVPVCNQYLVSGPGGVANSQLSSSSWWCQVNQQSHQCFPLSMNLFSAWYARLGCRGRVTGSWTSGYKDANQYVQVDFLHPTTVSSVVLTGRDPDYVQQYVTSFKFLYSDDCSLFKEIVDGYGNVVTLVGNSDGYEVLTRHLPERVQARCFRINPVTFYGIDLSLRFDLKGCR